jgi:prepilin-type N-terminal cleavage/methylation domain-containing protein
MVSAKRPRRPAFTLIELLVVIAILAMLISVLLPMVSRAKDIAIRVQCSTSQRTVGQGAQIFAASHGGRAPGHAIFTDGTEMGWYSYLHLVKQIGGLRLDERYIPKPVQTFGKPDNKKNISCPGMRNDLDWGGGYTISEGLPP